VSVSLVRDQKNRWRIDYRFKGKNTSFRLGGNISRRAAEAFFRDFEVLYRCRKHASTLQPETEKWLATMDDETHARLVERGLADARMPKVGLVEFLERHFAARLESGEVSQSTMLVWNRAVRWATRFFGKDARLDSLASKDFQSFHKFLLAQRGRCGQAFSHNTANKMCGVVSQALNAAVREGLLQRNCAAGAVKTSAGYNRQNEEYVSVDSIHRLISVSKCPEERLLLGLSRFAALRIPSEVRNLRWEDFKPCESSRTGILRVESPKTARYGKPQRVVPVCSELLNLLEDAKKGCESEFILPRLRTHSNLQMVVSRLRQKAGESSWRRVTHNLRASCLTDWRMLFPDVQVAGWAGHSPAILTHYYSRADRSDKSVQEAAGRMCFRRSDGDSAAAPVPTTDDFRAA
jgi:integrase